MQHEVCGLRWGDLSAGDCGAALLSDAKYGYSARSGRLALTLLRAPKAPDADADMGVHHFRYALLPHVGAVTGAGAALGGGGAVLAAAAQLNSPLLVSRIAPGLGGERLGVSLPAAEAAARSLAAAVAGMSKPQGGLAIFRVAPFGSAAAGSTSIVLDTVKLAQDGSGDVILRLYEALGHCAAVALLEVAFPVASVEVCVVISVKCASLLCRSRRRPRWQRVNLLEEPLAAQGLPVAASRAAASESAAESVTALRGPTAGAPQRGLLDYAPPAVQVRSGVAPAGGGPVLLAILRAFSRAQVAFSRQPAPSEPSVELLSHVAASRQVAIGDSDRGGRIKLALPPFCVLTLRIKLP